MLDFDCICEDVYYSNWFIILSESLTQADKIEIFNIALKVKAIKKNNSIDLTQKKELYKQLRERLKNIYLGSVHIAGNRQRVLSNIEDYLDNNIMKIRENPSLYKLTPESSKFLVYLLSTNT
jgi:hypothetical protein